MRPERSKIVHRSKVEEFYWAGRMVVYINNRLTDEGFDAACDRLAIEGRMDDLMPPELFPSQP